jgi:hypothetical protein
MYENSKYFGESTTMHESVVKSHLLPFLHGRNELRYLNINLKSL